MKGDKLKQMIYKYFDSLFKGLVLLYFAALI